jgi:hypothetical protein
MSSSAIAGLSLTSDTINSTSSDSQKSIRTSASSSSTNGGYLRMIAQAIDKLKRGQRSFVSRQAIKKYILENEYELLRNTDAAIFERSFRAACRRGVEHKVLLQQNQSFRVRTVTAKNKKKTSKARKPTRVAKNVSTKKPGVGRRSKIHHINGKPRNRKIVAELQQPRKRIINSSSSSSTSATKRGSASKPKKLAKSKE